MAGAQITVSQTQLESQRYGYHSISLTNLVGAAEPQIAAGSKVEIGGALFNFAAPESITGWGGIANDSVVWIKLVVAGAAVTAAFTTTAPTWSTSKQGWYDGLDRYIAELYKDGSGDYVSKYLIEQRNTEIVRATAIKGYQAISLTNIDNLLEPAIAAGSVVEVKGILYRFLADEAITGWGGLPSGKNVSIRLVPSNGSIGAEFNTFAFSWSKQKHGWYSGENRYVAFVRKDSGDDFRYKHIFPAIQQKEMWVPETIDIGEWNMATTDNIEVAHEGEDIADFRNIQAIIRNDTVSASYLLDCQDFNDAKPNGSVYSITDTNFKLERASGGFFDGVDFDLAGGYNRGWISFEYKVR